MIAVDRIALRVDNGHSHGRGIQRQADPAVFLQQLLLRGDAFLHLRAHAHQRLRQRTGTKVLLHDGRRQGVALGQRVGKLRQRLCFVVQCVQLASQLHGHDADEGGFHNHVAGVQHNDAEPAAGTEGLHRQTTRLQPIKREVVHGNRSGGYHHRQPVAVIQQQRQDHEDAEVHFHQPVCLLDGGSHQGHQHQRGGHTGQPRAGIEARLPQHQQQAGQRGRQEGRPLPLIPGQRQRASAL
ncbi:hypothetical protein [Xanthomonas campestris]|uniref:hypothetical protein n=1 Tax=Xanthomonas campestris TaxID=339 RepID=UPI00210A850C|nr:hypothetical protein [Xanthomonas campestris]